MAVTIDTPSSPFVTQSIALGGSTYEFIYTTNSREDDRVRLDILLDDTVVISGVKLMEEQRLLVSYNLVNFDHGDLLVVKIKDDGAPATLANIGIGLSYELIYLTNAEITTFEGS